MTTTTKRFFIIDFDSTFTKVEALEELCDIALEGRPEKADIVQRIKEITDLAMEGRISFREALEKRVDLLGANKKHIPILIARLTSKISESFRRNREFIIKNTDDILIISNGFKDFIIPIVAEYGIKESQVFANSFEYDSNGNIVGFDRENPLSVSNGKVEQIRRLKLEGDISVIGDGYNDYEIKKAGLANRFYAFTENVTRKNVTENANHVASALDEILHMNQYISFPKNKINVLLLENIHPEAIACFGDEGYNVQFLRDALNEEELIEKIKDVHILGIRSKTEVTRKVIEKADKLWAIGAFCIGTNQISLDACNEKGICVFNAPYSNTRSVVELAIAEIIMLLRNVIDKNVGMHQGKWNKSALNSFEVRGKKLGIVGYGNIGSQLSVLAESMGMDVHYYDVVERLSLGNATKCSSLEDLLRKVDVVTLHIDGRASNSNMFGEIQFGHMKEGAYLINLSRGSIVDIKALSNALKSGKLRGAAVDVFPYEPVGNNEEFVSELRGLPNVILTPHVGGSTIEAQQNIAQFVPDRVIQYMNAGTTTNSVNFPNLQLPPQEKGHRLIHVHRNVPGIMASISKVLYSHGCNITAQYLKTTEKIGYAIIEVDREYNPDVIKDLRNIEHTIKFRVLY